MKYINYCSGIYKIIDQTNEILYVGQAIDFEKRYKQHFQNLKSGTHEIKAFQEYADMIGVEGLSFVVIEPCRIEHLNIKEVFYIKKMRPLFNYCHSDEKMRSVNFNEEQTKLVGIVSKIDKISVSMGEIEELCKKGNVNVSKKLIGLTMPKLGWVKIRKRSEQNRTYFTKT